MLESWVHGAEEIANAREDNSGEDENPGCNDVSNDVVFVSQSDEASASHFGDVVDGELEHLADGEPALARVGLSAISPRESPPQYRLFVGPPEDPSWGIKDEVGPSDFFTTLNEDFPLAIPPRRP